MWMLHARCCDYGQAVGKVAEDADRCFVRVAGSGPSPATGSDQLISKVKNLDQAVVGAVRSGRADRAVG